MTLQGLSQVSYLECSRFLFYLMTDQKTKPSQQYKFLTVIAMASLLNLNGLS